MFEYIKQFNRPKYLFLSFYIIGLLVFTSSRTNCQSPDNYFYQRYFNKSWTANAHIALGGDYFASPSSVIKYSKYFLPIQFADNENLKDKISSNLINENYFGSGVDAYLSLTPGIDNLLKIKGLGVNFQIKSINHQKMLLTDDFFNILLEGNSMFAGKTAVMKPFDYNSYSYQEFQINFISSKITSKYKNLNYNIGISLLKGSTFAKIETDRATFFTSEEGDSIYADFKVDVMTSDRDQNDIYYVNGLVLQ